MRYPRRWHSFLVALSRSPGAPGAAPSPRARAAEPAPPCWIASSRLPDVESRDRGLTCAPTEAAGRSSRAGTREAAGRRTASRWSPAASRAGSPSLVRRRPGPPRALRRAATRGSSSPRGRRPAAASRLSASAARPRAATSGARISGSSRADGRGRGGSWQGCWTACTRGRPTGRRSRSSERPPRRPDGAAGGYGDRAGRTPGTAAVGTRRVRRRDEPTRSPDWRRPVHATGRLGQHGRLLCSSRRKRSAPAHARRPLVPSAPGRRPAARSLSCARSDWPELVRRRGHGGGSPKRASGSRSSAASHGSCRSPDSRWLARSDLPRAGGPGTTFSSPGRRRLRRVGFRLGGRPVRRRRRRPRRRRLRALRRS